MTEPIVIIGAGGHGREVLDIIEADNTAHDKPRWEFLGFLDDGAQATKALLVRGAKILGPVELLKDLEARYIVGIGSGQTREQIDQLCRAWGRRATTITHPAATMGADVTVGAGSVVAAGARMTTHIVLGRHVHVNLAATISHDCVLGDFVTLAPGANVAGNAAIGDRATIGLNAAILPGITVGAGAFIGAGAVVTRDVPENVTVAGVPARRLGR